MKGAARGSLQMQDPKVAKIAIWVYLWNAASFPHNSSRPAYCFYVRNRP